MFRSTQPTAALVEAFTRIASSIQASEDYEQTLHRITETAVDTVDGCEAASLSLMQRNTPVTRAATSPLASRGDQLQYDEGEGPCLDAAMHERWIYTPDLAADRRWPRSCRRMHDELGVASMFSCRLTLDAAPR